MVPAAVVALDALPLNANGKVDRRALPEPEEDLNTRGPVARNAGETALCEMWSEVLGQEHIGIDDDFFVLSGHSLLAARVAARIRRHFGVACPVRTVFEHPTVRRLAAVLARGGSAAAPASIDPDAEPAMSFAQQRLWFLDQMIANPAAYTVRSSYRIDGACDVDALQWALNQVWRRHDTLRTRCVSDRGVPGVEVADATSFPVPVDDLSELPADQVDDAVRLAARRQAENPFDLAKGRLFRARIIIAGAEQTFLVLTFHHLVVDGWSMIVLWRELSALYDSFVAGDDQPLPALPVQYPVYAGWQRSWLTSERAAGDLAFWRAHLYGAPTAIDLPLNRPRPVRSTGRGGAVRLSVPGHVTAALRTIGGDHHASLFMVLLTAFHILLGRYTNSGDIVTGSPIAGRVVPELDALIGFFVNSIPLRLRWSGDPTFVELLAAAQDMALDAYEHEATPFERIVEELGHDRQSDRNPVFQVWFDLDSVPEVTSPSGLQVRRLPAEITETRFDLELLLEEDGDTISGVLVYDLDLFDPATAARMARHFGILLDSIAKRPGAALSRLSSMDDRERAALLPRVAKPAVSKPVDLLASFAAQVQRSSDRVALVGRSGSLTYGDLDLRADRLARQLMARGAAVTPHVFRLIE